ncbi:hypothetical protein GKD95_06555 [Faecalibacterium prausnitzii]|uniref:Uncharacterized protein n=1 Tax=Faecalibacterium prausnitzii TaxID=853 RepID=A0A844DS01_9FIRM|nr:hypothetical protein [Faecalibacterium prausnitzii]
MRKNHHGKKDRLVKRVFALCLALAVICTCLVPVFATEGLIDPQVNQEASRPVDDGEASYPDDEFAGFGEEEATRPVDGGEAAGFGGDEVATRPVEGGEDNLDGGPSVKETEWGTVIEYGPSSSTGTDPEPETQWSGEDDVVEKPDDKVVVSGDEIKKLQDMVVYRFWLRELNTLDLQDITAQAQINNMTESEYLARNGEVLWNLYFIQAVPRAETIADYSSYIENPSSNRDPKGELRLFDYWYTLDEFGNRVRLNLTDPTSNILDDKTTTVNVYAAWKDGTVGSDEEEDVDHEDLVDKNPVPVDLTAKASASYEDEDGNTKSVNLPVEVKNLPSAADHLSVIHMGDDDMQTFYESHEDSFGEMMPILGLKISPKNAKGNTVQPAKGQKATVTVSGLDALPEMEGATASTLKVFHETSDGTVEILDVLTYTNGTLTFETSSFSPFVLVRTGGYDTELLDERAAKEIAINVGETQSVRGYYSGWYSSDHSWTSDNENVATVSGENGEATITGVGNGKVTITYKYYYKNKWDLLNEPGYYYDTWTVTVKDWKEEAGLYIMYDPEKDPDSNDTTMWTGVVKVGTEHAKLGDLNGATWTEDRNIFFRNIGGADSDTAKQYIKYWPDGAAYNGPRVLEPGNLFRQTDVTYNGKSATLENMIFEMYKGKLVTMYTDNGYSEAQANDIVRQLKARDITFTITPHKISKDNWESDPTNPRKHIDCTVTVTCDKTFTAKFNVKKPGESGYTTVNSKLYLWNDSADNKVEQYVNSTTVPSKIDKDGATWAFDGWYPEKRDGNGPDLTANPIPDTDWPYTVQQWQLDNYNKDRVVNFYAHYKKATSNVTITKQVTGLLGDTNKDFAFSVSITKKDGSDCSEGVTAKRDNGETVDLKNNFPLKHKETVTLENVPIGATITVTEETPGAHYKVSANGHDGEQSGSGPVTFTYVAVANTPTTTANDTGEAALMLLSMEEDTAVDADGDPVAYAAGTKVTNNAITVINRCDLMPDTGVLLDTLPYIVILAVVAGGVALLMLRKRRKEDD